MEDQQSASGDLTQKSVANGESTDTASAATEGHRGEIDAAGEPDERGAAVADSQADEDDSAATAARGGKTRARRSRGRRLAITVGVAAALFVGSAAFAGATVEPYLSERAVVATKLMVARTAANAITTLWTYTPENMDTLAGPRITSAVISRLSTADSSTRSPQQTNRPRLPTIPRSPVLPWNR